MDIFYIILKGFILGLTIAAPVGPISLLCISRSITNGRKAGLISGLGIALGDLTYAVIAIFGITVITTLLFEYINYIKMFGALFLILIAYQIFRKKVSPKTTKTEEKTLTYYFVSIYLLTLVNPLTIISFFAVFTGAGIVIDKTTWYLSIFLILGVFTGGITWFSLLAYIISGIRHYLSENMLSLINKCSALVLISFALLTTYEVFK